MGKLFDSKEDKDYYIHNTKRKELKDMELEFKLLGITLTQLEIKIYNWGKDNWSQWIDLLDKNITEETIKDYMIKNKCEDLPIDWVVGLITVE